MRGVILKTEYGQNGKSVGKGYVKYIAEREGVDKSINAKRPDINAKYIATRPGVVKLGKHGLFGQDDDITMFLLRFLHIMKLVCCFVYYMRINRFTKSCLQAFVLQ